MVVPGAAFALLCGCVRGQLSSDSAAQRRSVRRAEHRVPA